MTEDVFWVEKALDLAADVALGARVLLLLFGSVGPSVVLLLITRTTEDVSTGFAAGKAIWDLLVTLTVLFDQPTHGAICICTSSFRQRPARMNEGGPLVHRRRVYGE